MCPLLPPQWGEKPSASSCHLELWCPSGLPDVTSVSQRQAPQPPHSGFPIDPVSSPTFWRIQEASVFTLEALEKENSPRSLKNSWLFYTDGFHGGSCLSPSDARRIRGGGEQRPAGGQGKGHTSAPNLQPASALTAMPRGSCLETTKGAPH